MPAPIRVLHCIPAVWSASGGPTRAVVEMCRAVSDVDPQIVVDIATTDYGVDSAWLTHLQSRLPSRSRLLVFRQSGWLDKGWSIRMAKWLWTAVKSYDVVHTHALFSSNSSACAWIARHRRVPYVMRPLGTLSPYTFSARKRFLKRLYFGMIERRLLNDAFAVHFTADLEERKASRHGLRARPVVIPIPYNGAHVPPQARDDATVLFLSRIHPVKGLLVLLRAFAQVLAHKSNAKLIIAGAGSKPFEDQVRREVVVLGLSDAVEFLGFVDGEAKSALLSRATIFALPSFQENFGMAIVEALASSIPVVITREVDLWPDVSEFGSGIVIQNDVAELTAALLRLLADPSLRDEMGRNGVRQVRERYSPSVVGEQLANLYRSAAAKTTFDEKASTLRVSDRSAPGVA